MSADAADRATAVAVRALLKHHMAIDCTTPGKIGVTACGLIEVVKVGDSEEHAFREAVHALAGKLRSSKLQSDAGRSGS